MKNIKLFKTKKEYEGFIWDEIFTEPLLARHPFYRNCIQFVIDAKSPLFYTQSDPEEHANFSSYYNFELIREDYTNKTIRSMYFLHDFVHSLFYYPYDMASVTQEEFDDAVILSEYAASNETEILIHYRTPQIREKIFQDKKIFFDILRERDIRMPPVQSLFRVRRLMIETDILDPFFFTKPEDEDIRKMFKTFRGSRAWCKERFSETLKLTNPAEYFYEFLTPANYERVLQSYQPSAGEQTYRRVTLMNVRLAGTILGIRHIPETFEECFDAARELEGRVLFKKQRELSYAI